MIVGNSSVVDTKRCPLCGQPNNCGVSDGADCWCRSETFTEGLLSSIPAEQARQACICQNCVSEPTLPASDPS